MFRKKSGKFLKDRRGVSDALVMLLLLAVGAVVVAGIGSVLLAKAPKQTAPVANIAIDSVTGGIKIRHEGGDSIAPSDIRLVIYNYPSMTLVSNQTLPNPNPDIPPANLFSSGDVVSVSLNAGTYEVDLIYIPTQTKLVKQVVTVGS